MTGRLTSQYTSEEIKNYWKSQAEKYGSSHKASWQDLYMIEKEIETISSFLADGQKIIDIGCGNGYSTIRYAAEHDVNIEGVDYVDKLIEAARLNLKEFTGKIKSKVSFNKGDIINLSTPQECYDIVITARVFINLNNKENQEKALINCRKLVNRGGKVLLSEATVDGWKKLNDLRSECGLAEILVPSFNFYIDEEWFCGIAKKYFSKISVLNYSSTYYIGSRVVQPLILKIRGGEKVPDPLSHINRLFSFLPSYGDYGVQKLFVFEA